MSDSKSTCQTIRFRKDNLAEMKAYENMKATSVQRGISCNQVVINLLLEADKEEQSVSDIVNRIVDGVIAGLQNCSVEVYHGNTTDESFVFVENNADFIF